MEFLVKTILKKKTKWMCNFKIITKLQQSKQCGIGLKTDIDNGIELRVKNKLIHRWSITFQQECQDHSIRKE
jgi:hypothetical protein